MTVFRITVIRCGLLLSVCVGCPGVRAETTKHPASEGALDSVSFTVPDSSSVIADSAGKLPVRRHTPTANADRDSPVDLLPDIPPDLRPFVAQLDDPSPQRQIVAAMVLRDAGPRAAGAIPYLIRRFRSTATVELAPSVNGRPDSINVEILSPSRAAALALVAIGEPAMPHLHRALFHNDAAVRAGVCWVLGELKHASSVAPLMEAVKDKVDTVRTAAAEALGKIRDPRAIPLLVTLANEDDSKTVRSGAERALRNLTHVPALIEGLRDKSKLVQENCAYILWLTTAKEFGKDAARWEQWWQELHGKNQDSIHKQSVPSGKR